MGIWRLWNDWRYGLGCSELQRGLGIYDYDFSLSAHDSTYSGLLHWIGLRQVKDATPVSVNFHCPRACTHWNFFCFVFDNLLHVLQLSFVMKLWRRTFLGPKSSARTVHEGRQRGKR